MDKKRLLAWAGYDWANSAVTTLIFTFVFSVYFARGIYGDEVQGGAVWSFWQGVAGFVVALVAPPLGAAVDAYGPRKPVMMFLSVLCIILCAGLYFMLPQPAYVVPALVLGGVLAVVYELVQGVYASTLPYVGPHEKLGFVSGFGWGAGYVGAIICLVLSLVGFLGVGGMAPVLPVSTDMAHNVRCVFLFVAFWFAAFAVPFFVCCADAPKKNAQFLQATKNMLFDIRCSALAVWRTKGAMRFMVAAALYRDGLTTLFAVGGLYAGGTLGMDFGQIMMFAIGMNVAAGLGAMGFALIDDKIGAKVSVLVGLLGLIVFGAMAILVTDKWAFVALACVMGVFVGPVQASSRALLAHISPPEKLASFFGFYAMSGKGVAFVGPMAFAGLSFMFESQRVGMMSVIGLWTLGFMLLCCVRESQFKHVLE